MHAGVIDASVDTIPIAFDETAGSVIIPTCRGAHKVGFINLTEAVIAFTIGNYETAPSSVVSVNRNQGFVPMNGATTVEDVIISNNSRIYIRTDGGVPITSGKVYAFTWSL